MNIAYNMDCMESMRQMPDKCFDLAVVDPVYGDVTKGGYMKNSGGGVANQNKYVNSIWEQQKPGKEYFEELFRVSKNQIVFGGNYFVKEIGRNSQCWIVWDKDRPEGVDFADVELAWTSFDAASRIFRYRWNGMLQQEMKQKEIRIHPTQKPVALYAWIFSKYAKPGYKILDTHLGSGSSRIAAYNANLDFVGFEIDKDYFDMQEKRFSEHTAQISLFVGGTDGQQTD